MRVAFVAALTDRHEAAEPERAARVGRLARGLADRGHDVRLFCARFWSDGGTVHAVDGLDYHAVTTDPDGPFARRLPGALRRFDPDVVHAVHDDPTAVLAADLGGAPLVVDWYDRVDTPEGLRGAVRRRLWRRAARTPALVVVPSRLVETNVRELGRPAEGIEVVPTGVDLAAMRAVDPDPSAEIVYSRHLDADANLETLLLALAEFRRRDWTCAVIGDGPARPDYEAQARDLRIDDRVTFLGRLADRERWARFRGAHVYVHTATRAAFPTDLLRALAAGCLGVVTYETGSSAHELVEGRDRGYLATSPEGVADALAAAGDHEHRTADEAYAEYDEAPILRRYVECYRRVGVTAGD